MVFFSSELLCFYRAFCPLGHVFREVLKLGRSKNHVRSGKKLNYSTALEVWWHCDEHTRISGSGPFHPLPPLRTPCAVPTSFRHPSDCSTFLFLFVPVITVISGSPWSRKAGCDTDLVLRFYISCFPVRVSWDTYHCKMPEWITLLAHSTQEHTGGIFSLAAMRSLCLSYWDCMDTIVLY